MQLAGRRHPQISALLADAGGVLLGREVPELHRTLRREVERGTLTAVLPGTFVAAATASDPLVLARAVCHRHPDAVIAGRVAAALTFWPGSASLPLQVRGARIRVVRPWLRTGRAGVPPELVVDHGRVRLVAPALAALDLAPETGGESVHAWLRWSRGDADALHGAVAAFSRPGNRERRRWVRRAAGNAWSGGEHCVQQLLAGAGITGFAGNVPVRCGGRVHVLDLADRRRRLGLELDSVAFHTDREAFERDRRKHNDLEAAGWRVLHLTWRMVTDDPGTVLDQIRRLIAVARRP